MNKQCTRHSGILIGNPNRPVQSDFGQRLPLPSLFIDFVPLVSNSWGHACSWFGDIELLSISLIQLASWFVMTLHCHDCHVKNTQGYIPGFSCINHLKSPAIATVLPTWWVQSNLNRLVAAHLPLDLFFVLWRISIHSEVVTTLWWTNIAMENGHRNSGFSH